MKLSNTQGGKPTSMAILFATPDADLFLARAGLERGALVNQQAFKVCVQDSVVRIDADCKWRSIRMVAQGIHECDENTVLADELAHSTTPIWSELRLDRTEETGFLEEEGVSFCLVERNNSVPLYPSPPLRVIIDKLESSCRDVELEKIGLQELSMRFGDIFLGTDLERRRLWRTAERDMSCQNR